MKETEKQLLNPGERDMLVKESFHRFDEIASEYSSEVLQSNDLRNQVFSIAFHGIWGELNRMNPNFDRHLAEQKPLVFTGQQPTLDYGLYRRVAKRSGVHEAFTTVHSHADHDKAGKNGFSSFSLPIVSEHGIEFKTYGFASYYHEDEVMSDIGPPDEDEIFRFFKEIIGDLEDSRTHLDALKLDADTLILHKAREFILDRYEDIRSLAEFNAVLQTFVLRKKAPVDTVDVMLSDLLNADIVRKSFSEQIVELPSWLPKYSKAIKHLEQIPEIESSSIPKLPSKIEHEEGLLTEAPLWILTQSRNGTRKRERAWLLQSENSSSSEDIHELVLLNEQSGDITRYLKFGEFTSPDEISNDPNFRNIYPAAIMLVDLMRKKLKLPIIHGKTGYMYEALNELAEFIDEVPKGHVVNPMATKHIAPITTASFEEKARGSIRTLITKGKATLSKRGENAREQTEKLNNESKKSFQRLSEGLSLDLGNLSLEEVNRINQIPADHPLASLHAEVPILISALNSEETDTETQKGIKKLRTLLETLFDSSVSLGEEKFEYFLKQHGLEATTVLWHGLENWRDAKEKHEIVVNKKVLANKAESEIKEQEAQLAKHENSDIPLIEAVIYDARAIKAIPRLERQIIYKDKKQKGGDNNGKE